MKQSREEYVHSPSKEYLENIQHFKIMFDTGHMSLRQIYKLSTAHKELATYFNTQKNLDKLFHRLVVPAVEAYKTSEPYKKWLALLTTRSNKLQLLASLIMSMQRSFVLIRGDQTITFEDGKITTGSGIRPVSPNYINYWTKSLFQNTYFILSSGKRRNFLVHFIYDHLEVNWRLQTPCAICGRIDAHQVCGDCRITAYCGESCQRKDWLDHQILCIKQ